MSDDLLRDRLARATDTYDVVPASAVRGRARARRTRRRAMTAGALTAVAAVVAVGAVLGLPGSDRAETFPAEPTPTTTEQPPPPTPTPSPTDGQAPVQTSSDPEPPITQADLAGLRFADEEQWLADLDFPAELSEERGDWVAPACGFSGTAVPALPDTAAAQRTLVRPGPEAAVARQVVVFSDLDSADAAFADLRSAVRACQTQVQQTQDADPTSETVVSFSGNQLSLGVESFWLADAQVTRAGGSEVPGGLTTVLVQDANVVVVLTAETQQATQADAVAELSAEWDAVRPQYEALLR